MAEVKMTNEELAEFLNARIRRSAKWSIGKPEETTQFGMSIFNDPDGGIYSKKQLNKLAREVHDDIVSDYSFDQNLLNATRAVNFSVNYVKGQLKPLIKDQGFKLECLALQATHNFVEKKDNE